MTPTPSDSAGASESPRALRLTFSYRNREIRLVATRRVAMIAPPAIGAAPRAGASGQWCELRDAAGRRLYHRVLANPAVAGVEVFSEGPGTTVARVPGVTAQGEFEVIVPDLPEARTFACFGPPAGAANESAPAQEVFRADVDELRKRGDAAHSATPPSGTPRR